MDLHSNYAFWLLNNGIIKSYPSLDHDLDTDILLIGGGITGALIAYQLVKSGEKVTVVDRRDVCTGSSAASTAMLQYEIDVPLHRLIEMRGEDCAVSSYKSCENAIFNLQRIVAEINSSCKFQFKKSIYFTTNKKQEGMLETEYQTRKKYGFDVKWLTAGEIDELGLNARAAIESASGAIMDPHILANNLLLKCSDMGTEIFDRTEIRKIKEKRGILIASTQNKQTITARHIVHCTGYESVKTLHKKVVDLKSTYALISESFPELPRAFKEHIYWNTASPYLYLRPSHDERIIIGGGDEDFKNERKRDTLLGKKQEFLTEQFQKNFPEIKFKPDYVWAGTFGETNDGLPYFGRPKPGVNEHYVLGFGGNGITYSVMAMDAIIDSLNGTDHDFLKYYGFER